MKITNALILLAGLVATYAEAQQVCPTGIPASTPTTHFIDHGDGTVTHLRTRLMWKRCLEGLSGSDCIIGTTSTHTWPEALQLTEAHNFAGYDDWRLPDIKELASIVELKCYNPAINLDVFPYEQVSHFWSGSPDAYDSGRAWSLDFSNGNGFANGRGDDYRVRLVRGPVSAQPTTNYVALGDSYASGLGTFNYDPSTTELFGNKCFRSPEQTWSGPRPGGQDEISVPSNIAGPINRKLFACQGAVARHITYQSREFFGAGNSEIPQTDHTAELGEADIVTFTIGGNDVLFGKLLFECGDDSIDDCENHIPDDDDKTLGVQVNEALDGLYDTGRLDGLWYAYDAIKDAAPQASIFVLGYPDLIPESFSAPCTLEDNYSSAERLFFRETFEKLNQRIQCTAAEAGIHFVKTSGEVQPSHHSFLGHEICGRNSSDWIWGLNGFRPRNKVQEIAHPKNRGYQAMAAILDEYIKVNGGGSIPPNPEPMVPPECPDQPESAQGAVGSVLYESGELQVRTTDLSCNSGAQFVAGQAIEVFGAGFAPFTSISIRLKVSGYSQVIATSAADDKGFLNWSGTLPIDAPSEGEGFIKATGNSANGGKLSLYSMIELVPSSSTDSDNDGVPDVCDNCTGDLNFDQADSDNDSIGDACDACPFDAEDDFDGDGLCASEDSCPFDVDNDVNADGVCGDVDGKFDFLWKSGFEEGEASP